MKKTYEAKKNFWIGEINKELKTGTTVEYDDVVNLLILNGQRYEVKNLKAAIKAEWLVPVDGVLPELDGPIGETEAQAIERRRKARFVEHSKNTETKLKKDSQEVKKPVGCAEEGSDEFANALGIEKKPVQRGKFKTEVMEDDSKVVGITKVSDKEVEQIKKALKQPKEEKEKGTVEFKIHKDSFDDGSVQVGTYTSDNINQIVQNWSGLHWTKKDDIIKKASKEVLKELKVVESSKKIKERIQKRLDEEVAN